MDQRYGSNVEARDSVYIELEPGGTLLRVESLSGAQKILRTVVWIADVDVQVDSGTVYRIQTRI